MTVIVGVFIAAVWACGLAEHWRQEARHRRRELAEAQHDNAVLRAELEACRGTRRQLACDLEAQAAAGERQRERMAP